MNEQIEKLAIEAGLLNYVDNETPRRCFIDGNADLEEVQKFAELIYNDIITVVGAAALLNHSALDVLKNLKRLYEGVEK